MDTKAFSDDSIAYARDDALEWLDGNGDGYPRSWAAEAIRTELRMTIPSFRELERLEGYGERDAPPIVGYEMLEAEGLAVRLGTVMHNGEERVHFRLKEKVLEPGTLVGMFSVSDEKQPSIVFEQRTKGLGWKSVG